MPARAGDGNPLVAYLESHPGGRIVHGVYVSGDTHSSYMRQFGGVGRPGRTFIEAMKPLVDDQALPI